MDEFAEFEKVVAEQPTETPPVETIEGVVTETTETPQEVVEPVVEKTQDDYWSSLNEKYKTDFKSDDDFKTVLEKATKASALEEQLKELEALKADLDFYKENSDPLKDFASEDDYKVQQFKKAHPDKDASLAYKVFTADLDKLSDLDVLTQYEMLNTDVEGGEAGAKELVAQQFALDLETDPSEWSTLARNQLKKAANVVRKELKEMKDSYKVPEKVDLAAKRQADQEALAKHTESITKAWEEVLPKALNEIKEIEINDLDKDGKAEPLMKYVIDDETKKALGEEAKKILLANNAEVTPETGKWVDQYVKERYVISQLPKILKAYATTLTAEIDEKKDIETHNPVVVKNEVRPESVEDEETKRFLEFANKGSGFKYNKPF